MYDCMDVCVVLYDHVQSVRGTLVKYKKLVIQKKSFGGYNSVEEGSEFLDKYSMGFSLLSYSP